MLAVLLTTVRPADRLSAQGVLDQFSYDSLRASGLGVELGPLGTSRLRGAITGGLRFDAGNIAPRVRVLLGLTYFRSEFSQPELAKFASRLRVLVQDPDSNFTINVGRIFWSDLTGDLDFQYAIPQGRGVTTFLGLGVGVHWRRGRGSAINGTFVQDALDGLFPAANATVGAEFALSRTLRFTLQGRGVVSEGLSTVSLATGLMYAFRGAR
ncbi:MAG TPA: hypothetical protein VI160_10655 [Gemmatimonadales bacterium]